MNKNNPLQTATEALKEKPYQPQVLGIRQYPDPILSVVSDPVLTDIKNDMQLQRLLADMALTMMVTKAAGLAAVQVGVPLRVLVVADQNPRLPWEKPKVVKVINPRIVSISKEMDRRREGCLSFAGLFIAVPRPATCVVEYYNELGEKVSTEGNGLLARAIQHEIDHLDGKTFLDRVSAFARGEALRKNKFAQRRIRAAQRYDHENYPR